VDPDPDSMEPERGRPTVVVSDGPVLVQEWHEEQSQLLGHVAVVHSKVVLKIVTLLYDDLRYKPDIDLSIKFVQTSKEK
jgi:hypothetical protein